MSNKVSDYNERPCRMAHASHLKLKENIYGIEKDLLTKVGTVQGKKTF